MVATRQAASHILTLRMNPDKRMMCLITGDPSKITKKYHQMKETVCKSWSPVFRHFFNLNLRHALRRASHTQDCTDSSWHLRRPCRRVHVTN